MSIGDLGAALGEEPLALLAHLVTLTPCLRSSALTVLMLSACNSPETFWPLRFTRSSERRRLSWGILFLG